MAYYDLRHEGEDIDALLDKADAGELVEQKDLSKVATSGDYNDLGNKPNIPAIVASQIFLEFGGYRGDGTLMFTNKQGYEEHNREVCQRIAENFSRTPNDEIFFVTINGVRNGVPYMETAILESKNAELVKATFVKGYLGEDSSAAAQLSTIYIDASVLSDYAYEEESYFWWRYTSKDIPSVDDIGTGNESDVYVTDFSLERITTNGTTVNVSPELVSAIYNKKVIVIPSSKNQSYIATNNFSAPPDFPVNITMQIATGVYIYNVTLSGKGAAPQTAQTSVRVTNLLSGTLNTINGISLAKGADMQLVSSIALNGKTYTPTKGAVDLGEIEVDEVKFANDLTGVVEATPEMFTFRPSAGDKSVRDESAVIRRIKGNTSVWGQLVDGAHSKLDFDGISTTYDEETKEIILENISRSFNYSNGSTRDGFKPQISTIPNHKYIAFINKEYNGIGIITLTQYVTVPTNTIFSTPTSEKLALRITKDFDFATQCPIGEQIRFKLSIVDLTANFGAGNEPTTYEEFKALYPKKHYPYSAPVVRAMRVTGIETIGFNAYNGEYAEVIGGQPYYLGGAIASAHFATELGGEMTKITIPENRLYTPSENGYIYATGSDICINLSHSGVRNGEYKPYEKNTLLLPEIAKYFPNGMHGISDVCDEIIDGLAIQRCDVRAYEEGDENNAEVKTDKITTVYKLSEPIYTPIDEPLQLAYKVDDFGTERMLSNAPSAPFKADIVYQFNAEGRIRDNSRNIEKLEKLAKQTTENFATKDYVEQQLGNVQKGIVDVEDPTIDVLEPNKIYVYATNTLSSITINSFSTTDALTEEYVVQFRTFPLTESITLPSGVMWANGVTPTLEGDTLYELSIVKTHISGTDYFKAVLTPFK